MPDAVFILDSDSWFLTPLSFRYALSALRHCLCIRGKLQIPKFPGRPV